MNVVTRRLAGLLLLFAIAGCATPSIDTSEESAAAVRAQDLGSFPYHPAVYHLDLSILVYQLYAQSLVWGFDPYFEELDDLSGERGDFISKVQEWATTTGQAQVEAGAGIDAYRGPGVLGGFEDNPAHDPIVYQYSRVYPWSTGITNALDRWIEYRTPTTITDSIRDVYACTRTLGQPEGEVSLDMLSARQGGPAPDARDVLMVIEGGTGDKGEVDQPASQSIMALVLLRARAGDDYDVHIAFRGSRSGSGARAAFEALSTDDARGNPDWITDLGYREVDAPFITTTGQVSRGISRSVQSTFPQIFHCLDEVVAAERTAAPLNIYVTGHSLGGALAQHFASALLLGDTYRSDGEEMPESIRSWPWRQLKLITFSAPRVGSEPWAAALTSILESTFFVSRVGNPYDLNATSIVDLDIVPRLIDARRPAAYRVLLPTDPITSGRIQGGMPVGHAVYLEEPGTFDPVSLDFEAHEPLNVRNAALDTLRDERIPADAWAYYDMEALNPERDAEQAGDEAEYLKLAETMRRYHAEGDIWFDLDAFNAGVDTFVELLRTP